MISCDLHVGNVAFTIKFEFTMYSLDYNSMNPPNTGWTLGIIGSSEIDGGAGKKKSSVCVFKCTTGVWVTKKIKINLNRIDLFNLV